MNNPKLTSIQAAQIYKSIKDGDKPYKTIDMIKNKLLTGITRQEALELYFYFEERYLRR